MPELFAFSLFGCGFEVRHSGLAVRRAIEERLPPLKETGGGEVLLRRYSVALDGTGFVVGRERRRSATARTLSAAAELVVDDVERSLSRSVEGRIFVHAGAVCWRGRAILIPGRSGSGKSELVAALVQAGAGYLSDEFAVLDAEGRVHPYLRPLALRRASGIERTAIAASAETAAPVPVGRVAFLRYRPRARGIPARVSPGAALLGLLRHTLSCRHRLEDVRPILRRIAAATPAVAGPRGDADDTARMLLAGAEEGIGPGPAC